MFQGEQPVNPDYLTEQHEVPIHASLLRPILLMGVERKLVFAEIGLVLLLIVFTDYRLLGFLLAAAVGTLLHMGGLWLAKRDPMLAETYIRSRYYQDFYPARASRHAPPAHVRYTGPRS